jgi:hypothetical protein
MKKQFSAEHFERFCEQMIIDSKEKGLVPLRLNGAQKYFIKEMIDGLNMGIRRFTCLKGRQLGISTVSLALDLYWNFKFKGLQGTLVTDTETNRENFRSILTGYMNSLPKQWKVPVKQHNRTLMQLANRSRFIYQVAGTRSKGGLGRGTAVSFMHATEVSSWGDEEGLSSLLATLAETNPNRLYLFESTARGYNMFWDMWNEAKAAITQKAIFIGWWRHEGYSVEKGSQVYNVYWDGSLTSEERKKCREVKRLYDFDITPEQIAWWRWKENEVVSQGTNIFQEYPWTEDDAFIMSGSQFFTVEKLSEAMRFAKQEKAYTYRYTFGNEFDETELKECGDTNAELRIWQFPKKSGYYCMGADPAYGSSDWADRFAIAVYRVYADSMDQVAEYCTDSINTYQFAWVLAHLAGAYPHSQYNLEINGPGQSVWAEIQNIKRKAATMRDSHSSGIFNVVAGMREYLYKRPDSLSGGGYARHWVSTQNTKERMLNSFKDYFERGLCRVRSQGLLEEMKSIVRDGGSIEANGRGKDDRVIASGLASVLWNDQVRFQLVQMGETSTVAKTRERAENGEGPQETAVSNNIRSYLKSIGVA